MFKRMVCVVISMLMFFSVINGFAFSAYAESTGTATADEATRDEAYLLISDKAVENGTVIGIMGDADSNGKINIKDATAIQKYVANLILLSTRQLALADADNSAKINVKDATSVQKFLAGFEIKSVIKNTLYEVGTHCHSYSEASIVANCVRDGYTLFSCVCGDERKENATPAKGHNYTSKIVNATCTEDGYTEYICENCPDKYKEFLEEKLGHLNTETRNFKQASTTECGYSGDIYCADCGVLLAKGKKTDKIVIGKVPSYPGISDAEQYVFNQMNEARKAEGLKPLKWHSGIHPAANIRANEYYYWEIMGCQWDAHDRPNGEAYTDVFADVGVSKWDYKCNGENLACAIDDKFAAFELWMGSTMGHREAILDKDFKYVAISVVETPRGYCSCALFLGKEF